MADTVNVVSLQSRTRICFNLVFLIAIWSSCTVKGEQHRAVGPPQDIVRAVEGGDAILPCIIKPPYDMERGSGVEWTRPDRPDLDPRQYVYLRQDGRYIDGVVYPEYILRVSLLAEKLPHGDISLRLSGVERSDQGTYRCSVPFLDISTEIKLLVGSVRQPRISSNGSLLTCDSGCWSPKPEMSWLDSNGTAIDPAGPSVPDRTSLPAGPSVPDRTSLPDGPSVPDGTSQQCYEVHSTVPVTGPGLVTCRVHLPHFNHTVDVSFHIVISERDIPTEGASTGSAEIAVITLVFIIVILVFIIVILVAGGSFYYRRWKHAGNGRVVYSKAPMNGNDRVEGADETKSLNENDSVEEADETKPAWRKGSRETGIGDSACVSMYGTDDSGDDE